MSSLRMLPPKWKIPKDILAIIALETGMLVTQIPPMFCPCRTVILQLILAATDSSAFFLRTHPVMPTIVSKPLYMALQCPNMREIEPTDITTVVPRTEALMVAPAIKQDKLSTPFALYCHQTFTSVSPDHIFPVD